MRKKRKVAPYVLFVLVCIFCVTVCTSYTDTMEARMEAEYKQQREEEQREKEKEETPFDPSANERATAKARGVDVETNKKSTSTSSDYSWIEEHFSAWDGDCIPVKNAIKDLLKNPKSYDMESCYYTKGDDCIIVTTSFYATNAFNAEVLNTALSILHKNGKVEVLGID